MGGSHRYYPLDTVAISPSRSVVLKDPWQVLKLLYRIIHTTNSAAPVSRFHFFMGLASSPCGLLPHLRLQSLSYFGVVIPLWSSTTSAFAVPLILWGRHPLVVFYHICVCSPSHTLGSSSPCGLLPHLRLQSLLFFGVVILDFRPGDVPTSFGYPFLSPVSRPFMSYPCIHSSHLTLGDLV